MVHVHTKTGAPLEGATVVLLPPGSQDVSRERIAGAITDARGTARLPAVDGAHYQVAVLRIGFKREFQPVDLRARVAMSPREMSIGLTEAPRIDCVEPSLLWLRSRRQP